MLRSIIFFFFFFNDTATTEIYTFPYTTLFRSGIPRHEIKRQFTHLSYQTATSLQFAKVWRGPGSAACGPLRSEEHTSELQSRLHLVCRLLLEKKKKKKNNSYMKISQGRDQMKP